MVLLYSFYTAGDKIVSIHENAHAPSVYSPCCGSRNIRPFKPQNVNIKPPFLCSLTVVSVNPWYIEYGGGKYPWVRCDSTAPQSNQVSFHFALWAGVWHSIINVWALKGSLVTTSHTPHAHYRLFAMSTTVARLHGRQSKKGRLGVRVDSATVNIHFRSLKFKNRAWQCVRHWPALQYHWPRMMLVVKSKGRVEWAM